MAGMVLALPLALALAAGDAGAQTRQITVAGSEFRFNPNVITVKAGEEVVLVFQNKGRISHNLRIPAIGVGTATIGAGKTTEVRFVAAKSGAVSLEFACSLPGHASRGMRGKLVVK